MKVKSNFIKLKLKVKKMQQVTTINIYTRKITRNQQYVYIHNYQKTRKNLKKKKK